MTTNDALISCIKVLEDLRDNVLIHNETARGSIGRAIQDAQNALVGVWKSEPPPPAPVAPIPEPEPAPAPVPEPVPDSHTDDQPDSLGERRSEERDPGESDQHLAEALKLAPVQKPTNE